MQTFILSSYGKNNTK